MSVMHMRSVTRDTRAIGLGLSRVEKEISFWESKRKVRAVRQRLERLYTARKHLIESPEDSHSLVEQLKGIQNEST
jgi:hypothetical protein